MIADNRVVKSFVHRIREKLLDFDFDRQRDVIKASNTLAEGDRVDVCRHQNAVVERFESHVQVHLRARAHTDYGVAVALIDGDVEGTLAHLAGAVHEVEHRNGVRGRSEMGHKGRFYALAAVPRCSTSFPSPTTTPTASITRAPISTIDGSTAARGIHDQAMARDAASATIDGMSNSAALE